MIEETWDEQNKRILESIRLMKLGEEWMVDVRTKIQLLTCCPYCKKDFLITEKVKSDNTAKSTIEKIKW